MRAVRDSGRPIRAPPPCERTAESFARPRQPPFSAACEIVSLLAMRVLIPSFKSFAPGEAKSMKLKFCGQSDRPLEGCHGRLSSYNAPDMRKGTRRLQEEQRSHGELYLSEVRFRAFGPANGDLFPYCVSYYFRICLGSREKPTLVQCDNGCPRVFIASGGRRSARAATICAPRNSPIVWQIADRNRPTGSPWIHA
jgi:hypothetical protein